MFPGFRIFGQWNILITATSTLFSCVRKPITELISKAFFTQCWDEDTKYFYMLTKKTFVFVTAACIQLEVIHSLLFVCLINKNLILYCDIYIC